MINNKESLDDMDEKADKMKCTYFIIVAYAN